MRKNMEIKFKKGKKIDIPENIKIIRLVYKTPEPFSNKRVLQIHNDFLSSFNCEGDFLRKNYSIEFVVKFSQREYESTIEFFEERQRINLGRHCWRL